MNWLSVLEDFSNNMAGMGGFSLSSTDLDPQVLKPSQMRPCIRFFSFCSAVLGIFK